MIAQRHPKSHHKDNAVVASIKHAMLQIAVMQQCKFLFPLSKQKVFDLVPRQSFRLRGLFLKARAHFTAFSDHHVTSLKTEISAVDSLLQLNLNGVWKGVLQRALTK